MTDSHPSALGAPIPQEEIEKVFAEMREWLSHPARARDITQHGTVATADMRRWLSVLTRTLEEKDQQLAIVTQERDEALIPTVGRCDVGHHPKFTYDLEPLGGSKGCRMCELETAERTLEERTQERDKWKRRAQAFRRGRINEIAGRMRAVLRGAIDKHRAEAAEHALAVVHRGQEAQKEPE